MFSPVDHRVPRVYVPLADCPPDFVTKPETYAQMLFICRIVDWKEDSNFASGYVAAVGSRDDWDFYLEFLFSLSLLQTETEIC